MKRVFTKVLFLAVCVFSSFSNFSQCAATFAGGSSSNMYTQIRNATNPVVADKNLNTVVFIHRNNAGAFGGNSGHLRYDVSVNGGLSWTNDQGLLNPVNSSLARYPNVTIHNPSANINPANAYIGYMAATINSLNSTWNGVVSGVRQLSGAGNTENYNQPVLNPQLIPHSIVKGAPGVYWSIDALFNGSIITGFAVYKGVWNALSNDIVWSTNYTLTPNFATAGLVGDYNIAFDPSGNNGWFSYLSHLSGGPTANSIYYPVFYKTTNGGATWTGPIQVNLNNFTCITNNMVSPNVATTNFEHDLVVDVLGNPHLLTTICNGNNGYSVLYGSWHHMFDITQINGVWGAYDISNVNAGRGTWGISPNIATMDMAPQAARSADGSKLFFTWSDNANYMLGANNQTPNLFGRAFDVLQNKWTPIKDFTSCNPATNGLILFPHLAPEVLEPAANVYKLASVYGEYTVPNDPLLTANFKFLDNLIFSVSEFSVNNPGAVVNINQANPLLICPGSNIPISISGNYGQVLWSNGSVNNVTSVGTSTNTFYSVTAQQNCYLGIDTIFVSNMSFSAALGAQGICFGDSTQLAASGNALSYSWQPGAISGTLVTVSPASSTIYTLSASGSSCVSTETIQLGVFQLPTLSILGQDSLCGGSSITHTVTGASSYTWSHGAFGNIATTTPSANTNYTVIGVDTNFCANTKTISITLVALPNLSISSTRSVICRGESATITVSGANSYSWSGSGLNTSSIAVSPSLTATYSVSGTNTFGCMAYSQFTQSVSLCTGIGLEEFMANDVLVFPNPNSGNFVFQANASLELFLYNELGQLLRKEQLQENTNFKTEFSDVSAGVYFLSWTSPSGIQTRKVIVNP
jgi:hypothetical protein